MISRFAFLVCCALVCLFSSAVLAACQDSDGDGYQNDTLGGCPLPLDCNDQNASIHPGAVEVCNGFDDDCRARKRTYGLRLITIAPCSTMTRSMVSARPVARPTRTSTITEWTLLL